MKIDEITCKHVKISVSGLLLGLFKIFCQIAIRRPVSLSTKAPAADGGAGHHHSPTAWSGARRRWRTCRPPARPSSPGHDPLRDHRVHERGDIPREQRPQPGARRLRSADGRRGIALLDPASAGSTGLPRLRRRRDCARAEFEQGPACNEHRATAASDHGVEEYAALAWRTRDDCKRSAHPPRTGARGHLRELQGTIAPRMPPPRHVVRLGEDRGLRARAQGATVHMEQEARSWKGLAGEEVTGPRSVLEARLSPPDGARGDHGELRGRVCV